MTKRNRDEVLREGEAQLETWGVAPGADAASLSSWIGRETSADTAIAHRLGALVCEDSREILRGLEASAQDRIVKKEVKRALYRLQQRGISIPTGSAPVVAPLLASTVEGFVSPIDGRGDQLVWLLKPRPGGLLHLFGVINDPEGMREADVTVVSRKALKALRAELKSKHELEVVEASWRYCDFLLSRAFRWARDGQRRIDGDFPALRSQLLKDPAAEELAPLVLSHVDAAAVPPLSETSRVAQLLEEKEFRTWFFGPAELKPYLDELNGVRESPLVLDERQQSERFGAIIDRAVEELFGGALQQSWVRRIYEMAYFFWATRRAESAKLAIATARALSDSQQGGRGILFCEQLARASLAMFFKATVEEEAERAKSSLLVTPQQARAQRERR
jgi:hypothetical protein